MWTLIPLDEYTHRREKWPKKHKRELLGVHDNLDTFLKAIQRGQRPAEAKFGFIHPEPGGILAIDQKGGGPHLKETRLYVYPDTRNEELFVITLGDKDSQAADIETCKAFLKELRQDATTTTPTLSSREKTHVQE
jgi:hypothetical protein